jgi:hypothetical protein
MLHEALMGLDRKEEGEKRREGKPKRWKDREQESLSQGTDQKRIEESGRRNNVGAD